MAEGARRGSARRLGRLAAVGAVVLTLGAGATLTWAAPWSGSDEYEADCVAVGAAANAPGRFDGPGLELFRAADDAMGPFTVRRSFDPSLPASFEDSAAAVDAAAGLRSFVSWKPPRGDYRGAAAGRYDAQVRAWARSVPEDGVFATAFHEPENNMTGPEFVALQRHLYRVVKDANPTILWGPVYMAYWWDPEEKGHWIGDPQDWWPGEDHADFVGVDWYGPDPTPMTESRSFQTWYRFAEPTGLPLVIAEYGQYRRGHDEASDPAKERARARAIRQDAEWLMRNPRVVMWLYWNGVDANGDWRMQDEVSQRAWQEVARSGCEPAGSLRGATAAGGTAD